MFREMTALFATEKLGAKKASKVLPFKIYAALLLSEGRKDERRRRENKGGGKPYD